MVVGMATVFVILLIVIYLGKLLITLAVSYTHLICVPEGFLPIRGLRLCVGKKSCRQQYLQSAMNLSLIHICQHTIAPP